jgi:Na+-transporting NADH:ubiquinone oxidoreductase subunit NqrA
LPLRGIRFDGSSSIDGDTVLLGEVSSLGLEELCAQVTDFVIGITTLSRLSDFQMCVCRKKTLMVRRSPKGLFTLCLLELVVRS